MRRYLRLKRVALFTLAAILLVGFVPGLVYTLASPSAASADATGDSYVWTDQHHILDQTTGTTYVDGQDRCYSYSGANNCLGSYATTTDVLISSGPLQTNAPQCANADISDQDLYMWLIIGNYATATQGKFYSTCGGNWTGTPPPSTTPDFIGGLINTYDSLNNARFAQWLNGSTIKVTPDNVQFSESNDDGNGTMTLAGPENACNSGASNLVVKNYISATTATLHGYSTVQPGGRGGPVQCNAFTQTVPFLNKITSVATTAAWTNTTDPTLATYGTITIQNLSGSDSKGGALKVGDIYEETPAELPLSSYSGSDLTLNGPSGDCAQKLPVMTIKNYATAYLATIATHYVITGGSAHQQCKPVTVNVLLTNAFGDNGSSGPGGGGTTGQPCPIQGTSLGWLFCPLYDLGTVMLGKLNDNIQSTLYIDTGQLFGDGTQVNSFQTSFNIFRNVGLSLLVVSGLAMVLSQAAGLEVFSAYSVRKALPRIVMATIGLALAWPILQIVVTFFNDLGSWTSSIILAAAPPNTGGSISAIGDALMNSIFAVVAGTAIIFSIGVVGGLSLLVTFGLGLLIGYLVLVIRQLVVIVCILLAPLAIAASVLPGTERIWKFWRETLVGALVMFPIIMGFLSAGALLSAIAGAAAKSAESGGGGASAQSLEILSMIAYFAPYFMLPLAFRMASGIMGTIFGMVNDRGKGIFDRLRKFRQSEGEYLKEQRMAGRSRLDNVNIGKGPRRVNLGRAYRRLHTRGGVGAALIPGSRANAKYARLDQERLFRGSEKALKEAGNIIGDDTALDLASKDVVMTGRDAAGNAINERLNANSFERAYMFQTGRSQRDAQEALGAIETAFGHIGSSGSRVSSWRAKIASNSAYGFGEQAVVNATNDARRMIQNGDLSLGDAMNILKTSNPTRTDFNGVSWSAYTNALSQADDLRLGDGTFDSMIDSALDGQSLGRLLGAAHANSIKTFAPRIAQRVQADGAELQRAVARRQQGLPVPNYTDIERKYYQSIADLGSVLDVASQLSPENSTWLADQVMNQSVYMPPQILSRNGQPFGGGAQTLSKALEEQRSNPIVIQKRREFGAAAAFAQNQANQAAQQLGQTQAGQQAGQAQGNQPHP